MDGSWLQSLASYGPTVVLLFLLLVTLIRLAPTWKEVKLADNAARAQTAAALALIASAVTDSNKTRTQELAAITHWTEIMQNIAGEQRKNIDTVRIMQRVQADSTDRLTLSVHGLSERLAQLERLPTTRQKTNA